MHSRLSCLAWLAIAFLAPADAAFCPAKECALNETSEIARWECFGRRIFRPVDDDMSNAVFVEHQCEHFGWGNSMRSLSIAAQIAGAVDGRLTFKREFHDYWTLPNVYNPDHTYRRKPWDYEKYGRNRTKYQKWIKKMNKPGVIEKRYGKVILEPAICAADHDIIANGQCMTEAMPNFGKCLEYNALNIPIYYLTFRKPATTMINTMWEIRNRLSLPQLPKGLEPNPGSWGLYTPGYYIVGLHARMVPLGFEPLSVEYNEGRSLEYKTGNLHSFWSLARDAAAKAKKLAECRNETLLFYFATDDARNLRRVAEEQLGGYGRVMFGLREDEVGHMSPHWTHHEARAVDEKLRQVKELKQAAEAAAAAACSGDRCEEAKKISIAETDRSAEATRKHVHMSLAEWWILANAQWLIATPSSYSDTAGAWGLGPGGRMERMDISGRTFHRIDWNQDACVRVGAVDPEQARKCPNLS